ncbi:MAG: hypothetical protein ACJ79S_09945 [Gemmatimonadaceae bacterium]
MLRCAHVAACLATLAAPAAAQTTPAPIRVDASRLKGGEWRYRTTATSGGQTRTLKRVLTVSPATLDGAAAWLIVDRQDAGMAKVADSLYLRRSDAAPLRHRLHAGQVSAALDFGRDSVRGTMTLPEGSGPIAAPYPRGAMVTGTMLEMYLRLLPLAPGWTGELTMGAIGANGAVAVPVSVAVAGEENVTVPAGTFPSFLLSIRAQGSEQRAWVTRDGREVVRISAELGPSATATKVETVLESRR